jgi:1-acyl-sn-glycerol-3-phosphate acyltransferase
VSRAEDRPWARSDPAVAVREVVLRGVLGPLIDFYTRTEVHGHEHLAGLEPPVLFVANHSSHMDTPVLLRALPPAWRRRTAVAAAADYFYRARWLADAVSLGFNTVPVVRKGDSGALDAAAQLAWLTGAGWSLLMFAEGTRSRDGTVGALRTGAARLSAEHALPIVPVHVGGTHAVMPPGRGWMRRRSGRFSGGRHAIAVRFGPVILPGEHDHRLEVMERVRLFFASAGAVTTRDERLDASQPSAA